MNTPETYYTPCTRCNRRQTETPLQLDRSQHFHVCVDALGCLRTIKKQGYHTYIHGTSTRKQRIFALELADQKGVDLVAFIKVELELDDILKVSARALSAIIQGLLCKQIKAVRAA